MSTLDEMSLEELRALAAKVRERQKELKKSGKANERKIGTLARRRERLLERVREIDQQIEQLRLDLGSAPVMAPRRRGRRPKNAQIAVAS